MDQLDLNCILNRKEEEEKLIKTLNYFEQNKNNLNTTRGIYIYGSPGTGKSCFVKQILTKLNYDIILYDAGDIRNKNIIENITRENMSDTNIISMFQKKKKKIAIIMDEIDGMNSGDKGGINSLIKLIRPKKTKKQKKEDIAMVPIICIGNYHIDKKIIEMIKASIKIELKTPNDDDILKICKKLMNNIDSEILNSMVEYVKGDLRKLENIYKLYTNHESLMKNKLVTTIFQSKTFNEDTKDITKNILLNKYTIEDHNLIMNDTDRTSVGLLFHENIIDILNKLPDNISIPLYKNILNNFCFSDYLDRTTFQKQIWCFNEMSSLIKTFYNHVLLHENKNNSTTGLKGDARFTKVLTKYSTEYNNQLFIINLCQELNMDKKDVISYFIFLRDNNDIEKIYDIFENDNYNITKLDINRLYRFIDNIYTENYTELE
jgi:DNA polymerase III delta prime subunit